MKIEDGGPAFPVPQAYDEQGMTLRDYFAAKAMQAMITKGGGDGKTRGKQGVPVIAGFAYEYADAMLKAREIQ